MKCVKCGKYTMYPHKMCGPCAMKHTMDSISLIGSTPMIDEFKATPSDAHSEDYIKITYEPMPEVAKYLLPSGAISMPPFGALRPADPALEAIGRAFDDALDLAYLG